MISKLLVSGVFYLSRRRFPCVHKKLKIKKALKREDARQRAAWQLWKKYIQIVLKYWENDICIRCQWNISATFLTFWSIKGKNEFGMMSEWKFFECIMNKIWTYRKTNAEHFAHSEVPENIWKKYLTNAGKCVYCFL